MGIGKALLCTLGPSSLNRETIAGLEEIGVTGLRINLSHTDLEDLPTVVRFIQDRTRLPIWIDTEGAQIRTGRMGDAVHVLEGMQVRLVPHEIRGDASTIPITPGDSIGRLEVSARVSVDFDSAVLRIDRVGPAGAVATVLSGGEIGTHRAVTAFPTPRLPAFSEKDRRALRLAVDMGLRNFALSFCEHPSSVHRLRELVPPGSNIVAKIESREGVRNLGSIAPVVAGVLIDRGDLSREVRLEAIPLLQKAIIRKSNALGTPVYVATNLLESMVARRTPTRAEVNDVMNTLLDGAAGMVLAAETAIGKYPLEAARMIVALFREYEASVEGYRIEDLLGNHPLAMGGASAAGSSRAIRGPDTAIAVRSRGAGLRLQTARLRDALSKRRAGRALTRGA